MVSITLLAALLAATPMPTATTLPSPTAAVTRTIGTDSAALYLEQGVAAQAAGNLGEAQRAFDKAITLDRRAGKPGVEATYALAHVLHQQGRYRDAAKQLDELAVLAGQLLDAEMEAKARLDAMYLYARAHRPWQARDHAERLTAMARHPELSRETRRRIAMME